jgi:hypothetical protein
MWDEGRAAALHLLALICADALETMLTSWYATPGKVAWNAGGAISARWMGICDGGVSVHAFMRIKKHTIPYASCMPDCTELAPRARPLKLHWMKTAVRSVKAL